MAHIKGFQALNYLELPETFLPSAGRKAKHNSFFSCKNERSTGTIIQIFW